MTRAWYYICLGISLLTTLQCAAAAGDDEDDSKAQLVDHVEMRDTVVFSEIEESGRKRWEVRGTRAESVGKDTVRIYGVNATIITDDDKKIIVITDYADVNTKTRVIETDQYVTVMQGDHVLTGTGMHVDPDDKKRIQIFKDVQIISVRKDDETGINKLNPVR